MAAHQPRVLPHLEISDLEERYDSKGQLTRQLTDEDGNCKIDLWSGLENGKVAWQAKDQRSSGRATVLTRYNGSGVATIQETVTGMKVVQLFTREERNLRDFAELNGEHRDAWIRSIRYDAALFSVVEFAGGITVLRNPRSSTSRWLSFP